MSNKIVIRFIFTGIILGLAGCASYCPRPLNKLSSIVPSHIEEQFISFAYMIFDKSDCTKFFDRDILSKGYQPIQLTITNHSPRCLNISPLNFSFPCVTPGEVAQEVHTSTTKRVIGYGLVGLFLWPFIIPAIVDGVGSAQANKKLDHDFQQKTLTNQAIPPFSTINVVIFVPCEYYKPTFSFIITDLENHDRFMIGTNCPKVRLYAPKHFARKLIV